MNRGKEIQKALKRAWLKKSPTPAIVTLSVTGDCNRDCTACNPPRGADLSTDTLIGIIREAREEGAVRINLTGGEPLMREDIGILIQEAVDLDLEVELWTNGDLVEQKIDELLKLTSVVIGLDGPKQFHDDHRGEGSFSYAVGAARLLLMKGVPTTFTSLILKDSIFQIEPLLDIAERVGTTIAFSPALQKQFMTNKVNPLAEDFPQYRRTIDALIDHKNDGRPIANSVKGLQHLREWPDEANLKPCLWGYVHCRMEPGGELFMCHELSWPRPVTANVLDSGFKKAFRRLNPSKCSECWGSSRSEMYLIAQQKMAILFSLPDLPRIG